MSFWVWCAMLVTLAIAFPLVPLWRARRSAGGAAAAIGAGKAPRAARAWPAFAGAALVPVTAIALYLHLGAPAILEEQALTQARAAHDPDAMLRALEARLEKVPDDAEGWYTLGRAYVALKRHADGAKALARAVALAPREARYLSHRAEALALEAGSLEGRPHEMLLAALELDYEDEKALELAGLAAFEKGRWAESLHFWRRLLKRLPKDSEEHESIARAVGIAEREVEASGLGDRGRLVAPQPRSTPH